MNVVLTDDMDRCNPEKALEVLESIKRFFDIDGIMYLIGMNYNRIDSIIVRKFLFFERTVKDNYG